MPAVGRGLLMTFRPLTSVVTARGTLLAAMLLVTLGGCGSSCCSPDIAVAPPGELVCALETSCPDGQTYRFGKCVVSGCESDADCCPGTRCRLDLNSCYPYLLDSEFNCGTDADCSNAAQRCVPTKIGARDPVNACVYESCTGDADCGTGRSCFESRCLAHAPCNGACAEGQACDVATSKCAAVPAGVDSCKAACAANTMLVFTNPSTMSGETCCSIGCECKGLPPLVPTRVGRYAGVAVAGADVVVSAYDADYGDLALMHYDLEGALSRVEYLDGVPASGAVVADPAGPRGGVGEPGPNVGTHTSIAVDSQGLARIAYHDVDARALKVALQNSDGSFTTYPIDAPAGPNANVGLFTDTAIGADGRIYVSYLAHNLPGAIDADPRVSSLKLARSKVARPATPAEWELFSVDARTAFDACNGACAATEACVLAGSGAQCLPTAAPCSARCSSTQTCVKLDDGGGATHDECRAAAVPPESTEVPRGRGLYTSLVVDGSDALIASYDSIDGDVRLARVGPSGEATVAVVDGDGVDGHHGGDVGRFPTLGKSGDQIFVVYEDVSRHQLRAWQGTQLGHGGTFTTIDDGKAAGTAGLRFVGAGARMAMIDGSRPMVVYQDASTLDLKTAVLVGTTWTVATLLADGAHGFYADIAIATGRAYIASVKAELDSSGLERSRIGLSVRPLQ